MGVQGRAAATARANGGSHSPSAARPGGRLAEALRDVVEASIPLPRRLHHGVSEAICPADPDSGGVDLYWDKPRGEWPRDADGRLAMVTERLDLNDLMAQLER